MWPSDLTAHIHLTWEIQIRSLAQVTSSDLFKSCICSYLPTAWDRSRLLPCPMEIMREAIEETKNQNWHCVGGPSPEGSDQQQQQQQKQFDFNLILKSCLPQSNVVTSECNSVQTSEDTCSLKWSKTSHLSYDSCDVVSGFFCYVVRFRGHFNWDLSTWGSISNFNAWSSPIFRVYSAVSFLVKEQMR